MGIAADILAEIKNILSIEWTTRDGREVPESDDIQLGNEGVRLDATMLYADLADSTALVNQHKDWFAAEVFKSYLLAACRLITHNDGVITAFDGDRVMAVFVGGTKNTSAVRCALQINYVVKNIVNKALKEQYPSTSYTIRQAVGVDTGNVFVARAGRRGANDLIWVGRAANYAAKMCSLRDETYSSFITEDVFNKMQDTAKFGGDPKRSMWDKAMWPDQGIAIYKSSWWWNPD